MARGKKEQNITVENENSGETGVVDEPKAEIIVESAPEVTKTEVKTADEGVAELKKRLEASEENTRRLERERNEAVQRAYAAKNETNDTNARLFDSAQAQLVENNKYLKSQYALALQNQDFNAAADIQEAMALNQAKVLQIENGKQALKETPREAPLDPVEAFISNAKLGPRPAAWIRAHPEYATNQRLTQKMIAADNVADGDGFARGTDEYFARVEEILKINQRAPTRAAQDDDDEDERFSEASRPTSGRQTAPSAIPVSRDVSTSGTRQRTIRLSAAEAEAAELSGISHEEYARNRDAYRAERGGRLN
jgi:hypothetical protein